ncbi:MAG TPA: hypothetical protein VF363_09510 [Candidatus Eisenbacteria bacterium]
MTGFDRILGTTVRVTGIFQVLLGLLFWFNVGRQLTPLHMLVGTLFVLSLWGLAVRGLASGAARGLAALTLAWGAGAIAFGMTQAQILPGASHWVIQTLHLIVGVVAMRLGNVLAMRMKRAGALRPRPAAVGLVPTRDAE